MTDKEKKYNALLDDFLDGTMCMDDQLDFVKKYKHDALMVQHFNRRKEINRAISDDKYDNVKELIGEILQKDNNNPYSSWKILSFQRLLAIAAVLLILLTVGITTKLFVKPSTDNRLLSEYFEPYSIYNTFRSGNEEESLLSSAFSLYDNKKYEEAYQLFNKWDKGDQKEIMIDFYKANCLIALKNYPAAEELFEKIISKGNNLFDKPSNWYLALSYLGNNQVQKAKEQLNIVIENESIYQTQAKTLLDKLQ